jgi:hypothetical protein
MRANQFYLVLLIVLLALPVTAQVSKRKAKPGGKATPAQQPKTTNQPDALTEEDQRAAADGRITTHELKRKLEAKADIVIVDNRDGRAWIGSSVKLPGAIHIPLSQLQERMHELPKDKEIITYCT